MKNQKHFRSKTALLLDTLNYYSEDYSNRRCIDKNGNCCYFPTTPFSEGCAIGRVIPKALAKQLSIENDNIRSIIQEKRFNLPKWLINMGEDFLFNLQWLHDRKSNWNDKGLSCNGVDQLKKIIDTYQLPKHRFNKYLNT